jgi:hypothetical protein
MDMQDEHPAQVGSMAMELVYAGRHEAWIRSMEM